MNAIGSCFGNNRVSMIYIHQRLLFSSIACRLVVDTYALLCTHILCMDLLQSQSYRHTCIKHPSLLKYLSASVQWYGMIYGVKGSRLPYLVCVILPIRLAPPPSLNTIPYSWLDSKCTAILSISRCWGKIWSWYDLECSSGDTNNTTHRWLK